MITSDQIKKEQHRITRLERNLALDKVKQRKADTRRKIEFGGLVIKAGMGEYSKDIILGALIDAVEALQKYEGAALLYQSKGQAAFMGYTEAWS